MDGVRAAELILNTGFLLNVVRVLWTIVKENQLVTEFDHLKKSVKAALMLIPLLGIPNFLQVVPFIPSSDNIYFFAVFTYTASVFFMFQGFMIAVLYCFTNREVINVVKSHWSRYRLRHTSADTLRRGSRAPSIFYQGTATGGGATVTVHNQMFSSSFTRQSLVAPLKDDNCDVQRRRVTAPDLADAVENDGSEYATTMNSTPPLQGMSRNCLSDRNGLATKFCQVRYL
uniref:G-protein coupled receptors family 2 profile 2 domain-containing protein n=1 Tax=Romanomermis culicivorax TaxID=13658 RepID=A0A915HK85_ROMCU